MDEETTGRSRTPIVILASGSGTLAQSILDAAAVEHCPFTVTAVVSDRQCEALSRATRAGAATAIVSPAQHPDRDDWDRALTDAVAEFAPDWVVSAGFMRILGAAFLDRFPNRVLNSHPALLPAFPGAHAVRDALAYGVAVTGCTVHIVDAGVDTGPIVAQQAVEINDDDSQSTLHERIKVHERHMLVDVLGCAARGQLKIEGRKVVRS